MANSENGKIYVRRHGTIYSLNSKKLSYRRHIWSHSTPYGKICGCGCVENELANLKMVQSTLEDKALYTL
jgi:hypothetical protein